jgi:hypothetical protein
MGETIAPEGDSVSISIFNLQNKLDKILKSCNEVLNELLSMFPLSYKAHQEIVHYE